jgi:integrase
LTHVLNRDLKNMKFGYAKKLRNLPTVLNAQEVQKILKCMSGKYWLITGILYGSGLRVTTHMFRHSFIKYVLAFYPSGHPADVQI